MRMRFCRVPFQAIKATGGTDIALHAATVVNRDALGGRDVHHRQHISGATMGMPRTGVQEIGTLPEGVPLTLVNANTTYGFLSEVHQFRTVVIDPAISDAAKRSAYVMIVSHAAAVDPKDVGFERVGVALKEALSMWLDCRPGSGH